MPIVNGPFIPGETIEELMADRDELKAKVEKYEKVIQKAKHYIYDQCLEGTGRLNEILSSAFNLSSGE